MGFIAKPIIFVQWDFQRTKWYLKQRVDLASKGQTAGMLTTERILRTPKNTTVPISSCTCSEQSDEEFAGTSFLRVPVGVLLLSKKRRAALSGKEGHWQESENEHCFFFGGGGGFGCYYLLLFFLIYFFVKQSVFSNGWAKMKSPERQLLSWLEAGSQLLTGSVSDST